MKKLQRWILIMSLIASAAGAAAGTVLSGFVQGDINVAVSQPLKVEKPSVTKVNGNPFPHAWFSAVSDQSTEFSAALQLYQGEAAMVNLPIVNRANVSHVVEINITAPVLPVPQGANPSDYSINLDVDGSGLIQDVVRVGPYKWKATIPDGSNGTSGVPFDGLKLTVALGDMLPPGYYAISGQIQIVPY